MDKKKFYMTTAIAYTSGKPHIGNTYEIVLADSIARFTDFLRVSPENLPGRAARGSWPNRPRDVSLRR